MMSKYTKLSDGFFAGHLSFFSAAPAFAPSVPAILILSLAFSGSAQSWPGFYRGQ